MFVVYSNRYFFNVVPSSEETSFSGLLRSIFQSSLHTLHIATHAGPSVWAAIHVLHYSHPYMSTSIACIGYLTHHIAEPTIYRWFSCRCHVSCLICGFNGWCLTGLCLYMATNEGFLSSFKSTSLKWAQMAPRSGHLQTEIVETTLVVSRFNDNKQVSFRVVSG